MTAIAIAAAVANVTVMTIVTANATTIAIADVNLAKTINNNF